MTDHLTIDFPSVLPEALVEDFSIEPNRAFIVTQMDAGNRRLRRRYTDVPEKYRLIWNFSQTEFSAFQAWYQYDLRSGELFALTPIRIGDDLVSTTIRFLSNYSAALVSSDRWNVSANVEKVFGELI